MREANGDLVIGLGNPLRGDDGLGWWLARQAQGLRPAARVMALQQLTPELATELVETRRLLLMDAWWPPDNDPDRQSGGRGTGAPMRARGPCLRRLPQRDGPVEPGAFSHQLDPAQLLAITRFLYGRAPETWQLLVPAYAMPHDDGFSPQLRRLLPRAQALLIRWWDRGDDGAASHA